MTQAARYQAAFWAVAVPPLVLLVLGSFGVPWTARSGLLWMAVLTPLADRLLPPESGQGTGEGTGLLVTLTAGHLLLLLLVVAAVGRGTGSLALYVGTALYAGQVANAAAHELIHRRKRWLFRLGTAVFTAHLFGHHTSAHRLVHHRYVATPQDPNSAPLGEGFWRFAPRAALGSFRAGLQAEGKRRDPWRGPYGAYVGGGLAGLGLALALGGPTGVLVYGAIATAASLQLLLVDYVQHYGLSRPEGTPVGPEHSWNSPARFSGQLLVHAARHSDHHMHPSTPYPALSPEGPTLPRGLPTMSAIAMVPPLWRRIMDRRVRRL